MICRNKLKLGWTDFNVFTFLLYESTTKASIFNMSNFKSRVEG